ncbi:predicted protein [Postia placenta Mad-698-R]|nr:predicted protein [Postia placenta Mad-698-R]
MKRRNNDAKVIALLVEMRDMIGVLLQLKSVKDEAITGPKGVTIEARMQGLMKQTANDIRSCGNMSLLAKVLKGPLWENTFANFVSMFSQRRDDIEFALSIHIAGKVDGLHEKVDDLAQIVERKTDMILEFLKNYIPPEHTDVCKQIDRRGGREAVLKNDDALQELVSARLEPNSSRPSNQATALARNAKHELESQLIDPAFQIQNNTQSFDRKFEMQQRQILEGRLPIPSPFLQATPRSTTIPADWQPNPGWTPKGSCRRCGSSRHWVRDCPDVRCAGCGKEAPGHLERECGTRPMKRHVSAPPEEPAQRVGVVVDNVFLEGIINEAKERKEKERQTKAIPIPPPRSANPEPPGQSRRGTFAPPPRYTRCLSQRRNARKEWFDEEEDDGVDWELYGDGPILAPVLALTRRLNIM